MATSVVHIVAASVVGALVARVPSQRDVSVAQLQRISIIRVVGAFVGRETGEGRRDAVGVAFLAER